MLLLCCPKLIAVSQLLQQGRLRAKKTLGCWLAVLSCSVCWRLWSSLSCCFQSSLSLCPELDLGTGFLEEKHVFRQMFNELHTAVSEELIVKISRVRVLDVE